MYIVHRTRYDVYIYNIYIYNIGRAWDLRPKWREHSARDPQRWSTKKRERGRGTQTLSTSRPQETTIIVSCTYLYVYMYTYVTVLEKYERWRTLNFQPFYRFCIMCDLWKLAREG